MIMIASRNCCLTLKCKSLFRTTHEKSHVLKMLCNNLVFNGRLKHFLLDVCHKRKGETQENLSKLLEYNFSLGSSISSAAVVLTREKMQI